MGRDVGGEGDSESVGERDLELVSELVQDLLVSVQISRRSGTDKPGQSKEGTGSE